MPDITFEKAHAIAARYVEGMSTGIEADALVMSPTPVAFGDYGWVFAYQNRKFLDSGDFRDAIAGNAPLLVSKATGEIVVLGTAFSIDHYINAFLAFGDPHLVAGSTLQVKHWGDAPAMAAIKEIRQHSDWGLARAKKAVDRCQIGEQPLINCKSASDAMTLGVKLEKLGVSVQHIGASP
ncbi:YrhB domain-containing protein [uncultured Shimia sp.]|uniref:YrhB domain-containing protein n=1 Tax=uncultured Shimia sp. TaxID=573152 RepID=UPI0025D0570A|nr:YrhB domain-containing protein [uncultured Shimia sp.]